MATAKTATLTFRIEPGLKEALQVTGGMTYQRDNETGAITVDGSDEGLGVLSVRAKVAKSKGLERAKVDVVLDRLLEKDNETVA